ncbi:hypothetical protein RCL_jg23208.t1 [Rhizophagus clarus]|uniref:Uncharacterized protein n=1 Tax=Rhizophagus clarus TaxID=94130 RepID=A0A8H3QG04_9GLOM|nr:hypothetical protein RCL_jg23208.t1 [Rhizophagus clarus]
MFRPSKVINSGCVVPYKNYNNLTPFKGPAEIVNFLGSLNTKNNDFKIGARARVGELSVDSEKVCKIFN